MTSNTATYDRGEIDVISFLRVLWDSKWLVIGIATLFGSAAVLYALLATPIYRADVVVTQVSDNNISGAASLASQFAGLGNLVGANIGASSSDRDAQAFLKSRRLAEEFIARKDLLPVLYGEGGDTQSLWFAVKRFREQILSINENATDGITTVAMSWTDPETAADWANEYVALANELIRGRVRDDASRNIEYLNERIEETNVVEIERVMYNLLESETKTLMLANARAEYAFTVIDPAVTPELRASPKRKVIVLSGGALGVFCGAALVFLISLYRRVKGAETS